MSGLEDKQHPDLADWLAESFRGCLRSRLDRKKAHSVYAAI